MPSYSFFPWMGGKSKMAARLCQLLPDHRCYVEAFAGAANLLFAKPPSRTEILNDINDELVTLFRVIQFHRREFLRTLQLVTHSRKNFDDFKSQPGLTDIQKAARTWFILKAAFGGMGGTRSSSFGYGTTGKAHYKRSAFAAVHRCHKRLDGVTIENLDFADLIARYDRPHTVFYCDPPYWQTGGYRDGFTWADHQRLAEALRSIKGKFLLSINDHPDVRKLYKGLPCRKIAVKYSVARDKSPSARDRQELLIANYKLPKQ